MHDGRHLVLILDSDAAVRAALQFALQLEGADLLADPDLSYAGCIILDDQNPAYGCLPTHEPTSNPEHPSAHYSSHQPCNRRPACTRQCGRHPTRFGKAFVRQHIAHQRYDGPE
jgi:hypothetical protein